MSFSNDLKKFANKTEKNAEKLVRGTALAVFGSVIKRTPVKTGRARGNWQTDVNKPAQGTVDTLDKTGSKALRDAVNKSKPFKLGDSIYMVNNLPYILKLENGGVGGGGSTQAPNGMVKVTLNEFKSEVNRQAKKL